MEGVISANSYGKSRVRVTKLTRGKLDHRIRTYTIDVRLHGDLESSYTQADNRLVVPTDTIKNTCYAVAADAPMESAEEYTLRLTKHFLDRYSHLSACKVETVEDLWVRAVNGTVSGADILAANGGTKAAPGQHPSAFVHRGDEKHIVTVTRTRANIGAPQVVSQLKGLHVLRTAGSEFAGFHRCENTTLQDSHDRIFATVVDCSWTYNRIEGVDFDKVYHQVRDAIVSVFHSHHSMSVQATMYEMLLMILRRSECIERSYMTLPNKHHVPMDLSKLDNRKNKNEIFITTEEPQGMIFCEVTRKRSKM